MMYDIAEFYYPVHMKREKREIFIKAKNYSKHNTEKSDTCSV
jgi:hypothetical protein